MSFDADQVLRAELNVAPDARLIIEDAERAVDLVSRYAIWLPTSVYEATPWLAPFAVRSVRVRSDERVAGPARDLWGLPDPLGRFTDDNSLIKATVRGRFTEGPQNPYPKTPIGRGLVCCHIWPRTTGDPNLFSFVPNLVWLPRSLASLSDAHFTHRPVHPVHYALQQMSIDRYGSADVSLPTAATTLSDLATSKVVHFERDRATELRDAGQISRGVNRRTARFLTFIDAALAGEPTTRRMSRRFHAGRGPRIDHSVPSVTELVQRAALIELRDFVLARSTVQPS